ncbi:hypothetical protein NL676_036050 [Syzygium grande]|nr:hypothetical protein NL676_036050 [Syzygium grande]
MGGGQAALPNSASSHRRDGRGGGKLTCPCPAGPYFKLSQSSPSLRASGPKSRSRLAPRRYSGKNLIQACARVGAAGSDPISSKVSDFKDACWRFLRPHTIRGTALGSFSLVARALIENLHLIKWSLLLKAFSGLFALICGNAYIVGINQTYDIGIDNSASSHCRDGCGGGQADVPMPRRSLLKLLAEFAVARASGPCLIETRPEKIQRKNLSRYASLLLRVSFRCEASRCLPAVQVRVIL